MRFLNRAHLSDKARRLTSKDLKVTIATMLMLQRYPLEYKCAHCDMQNVRYIQHLECCKKSHRTNKKNENGELETKYGNRSHALHAALKKLFIEHLNRIPDLTVSFKEPLCEGEDHFTLNDHIPVEHPPQTIARNNSDVQPNNSLPV